MRPHLSEVQDASVAVSFARTRRKAFEPGVLFRLDAYSQVIARWIGSRATSCRFGQISRSSSTRWADGLSTDTYFTCAKPLAGMLSAIALMDDDASSLLTAQRPTTALVRPRMEITWVRRHFLPIYSLQTNKITHSWKSLTDLGIEMHHERRPRPFVAQWHEDEPVLELGDSNAW